MVEPPLVALNTTVAGWWLARPYSGDVLASYRGRSHLGTCRDSVCTTDPWTPLAWDCATHWSHCDLDPFRVGCLEYPRQSDCRIIAAVVSAVPNRGISSIDGSGGFLFLLKLRLCRRKGMSRITVESSLVEICLETQWIVRGGRRETMRSPSNRPAFQCDAW
jgi:hypothetical protein